jgi:hypothetical protein
VEECEAITADYLAMLASECSGQRYSKAEHRRALQLKLNDRSEGSIEYKHQNISAVLLRNGFAYLSGYKPAWNYQSLLADIVLSQLNAREKELGELEEKLLEQDTPVQSVLNWQAVFKDPPERLDEEKIAKPSRPTPRKINFAEREARNRKLGYKGEEFVIDLERTRLADIGREDLAKEVEWTSRDKGDGAGYDIRSFNGLTDDEMYVEVKTTNSGKYQPFLISVNEVAFSDEFSSKYALYRVFDFKSSPAIFRLIGSIRANVNLTPKLFFASF